MKKIFYLLLFAVLAFENATVSAKSLTMLFEPKADSKVIGSVDTEKGITIVYSPKNSDWIKVANPENGDVGWLKTKELADNGFNIKADVANDGSHSYSTFQINTNSLSNQQLAKQMELVTQQHYIMQAHMARMMNDLFNYPFYSSAPIIIPVVVQAGNAPSQKNHPVTQTKTA